MTDEQDLKKRDVVAIIVTDSDGTIISCNKKSRELFNSNENRNGVSVFKLFKLFKENNQALIDQFHEMHTIDLELTLKESKGYSPYYFLTIDKTVFDDKVMLIFKNISQTTENNKIMKSDLNDKTLLTEIRGIINSDAKLDSKLQNICDSLTHIMKLQSTEIKITNWHRPKRTFFNSGYGEVYKPVTEVKSRLNDKSKGESKTVKHTEQLHCNGHTYGSFEIKYSTENLYIKDHNIFKMIADDLSLALYAYEAKEEQKRLNQIIKTIPEPMTLISKNLTLLAANKAAFEYWGLDYQNILHVYVGNVVNPETFKNEIEKRMLQALEGKSVSFTLNVYVPNKGRRWVNFNYYPFYNIHNDVEGLVTHEVDVTKQKELDLKLRESNERYDLAIDASHDGLIDWDIEKDIIFCSPQWKKMLGYSRSTDFSSIEKLKKALHTDCISFLEELKQGFDGTSKRFNHQLKFFSYTGKIVHVQSTSIVLYKNRKPYRVVCTHRDITELKLKQEALQKAREEALQYLDLAGGIIISIDCKGIITLINSVGLEILEYNRDEFVGKNWFDLCIPQDIRAEIKKVFSKLMNGDLENVQRYENTVLTKSGEIKNVSWFNTILRKNGKITGLLSSGLDITERVNAENELKLQKERFDYSVNATNDGLWDWNLLTNDIYYSPTWKSMLGYEYDELPNDFSVWEKLTAPEDVKKSWEMIQKTIQGELDKFEIEFKMRHKDGHWVDILSRAKPIFNEEGKAVRVVGTHVDISMSKRIEKQLKLSEERFDLAMAASQDGLFDWDLKTNNVYYSAQWKKMLGYEDNEIENDFSEWERLTDPEDVKKVMGRFDDLFANRQERFTLDFRMKHKKGKWVDILAKAIIIYDEEGKPHRVVGTHIDVTDRNRYRADLEKHKQHLEEMIKQRTAELEEKNKELERFNNLFVGREFRIKELRDKVKELQQKLKTIDTVD